MATIINDPDTRTVETRTEDSGAGLILGVIVAIILIALFFIYGLPALRSGGAVNNGNTSTPNPSNNINVQLPPNQSGSQSGQPSGSTGSTGGNTSSGGSASGSVGGSVNGSAGGSASGATK